ncbi:MAG: hypothetical protein H7329_20920 [Opitutaceae bacterium]|nr:hypothetical protein [Cytophagales bacterium]
MAAFTKDTGLVSKLKVLANNTEITNWNPKMSPKLNLIRISDDYLKANKNTATSYLFP